jgi:D-glycero-beta-D-manno-heptose 1-phosphate adenylyltransferase
MTPPGTGAVTRNPSFEKKICPPGELPARLRELARPMVFTNGVFDLLHRGHATYLADARALGSSLIVALNSDESVRRLGKGTDRPINTLDDRLALVAALESVSVATWFEQDTPVDLILGCRPDVLVKGGDWPIETIVGGKEVEGWGGKVVSIPFRFERSTTSLISRIRRS